MLSNRIALILVTALAPMIWGTTYYVTTELLPPDRPLFASLVRALPAGLLLVAVTRRLPSGDWWWRALVLGTLNIGAFLPLLFLAAYRLPGGVAATVGAIQPLIVVGLSAVVLNDRLTLRKALAGVGGVFGVALLVLRANAQLDMLGVFAALAGAFVMGTGVVLSKRWVSPAPVLATTGWQLVAGGVLLLPVTLIVEGVPSEITGQNVLGLAYLSIVGAAITYALWFRGIRSLTAVNVTFLSLLSPVVATVVGWLALDQKLSAAQLIGALIVLVSLIAAQTQGVNNADDRVRSRGNRRAPSRSRSLVSKP
ncbi:EamA family transporter [Kibdelosporangium aridum]|uniref:EamA family transporter n=1 Tax=Kibdelosporangium aridum TaxID=2030 RepID=A0A428Z1U8_KIBAR|nr:EamA family transporter [Kibdelosporangium aridum]RSM79020.1 EamA family transporter [Kibdelosporangium aridum]